MKEQERDQIRIVLQNVEEQRKSIPTFSDLTDHPVFGATFAEMKPAQKAEVNALIVAYITEKIQSLTKTKG